jgi:hypothetical protein
MYRYKHLLVAVGATVILISVGWVFAVHRQVMAEPLSYDFTYTATDTAKECYLMDTVQFQSLITNTGEPDTYVVTRIENPPTPEDWWVRFCVGGVCYDSSTTLVKRYIEPEEPAEVLLDIIPRSPAEGSITITVRSTFNPSLSKSKTFLLKAESAGPGKEFTPSDMISPPLWATNGGSTTDSMFFDNTGTADLYVKISGPTYVTTINPNQFVIAEGAAGQKVYLTFTAPHPDTFLVDSLKIVSNDGVVGGGEIYADTEWMPFHFVVTDTFYRAEFDSCLRGVKLMVSNVGNLGHQEPGYMMNFNNHGYLSDYSPAFATDAGGLGKLSFTWVRKNNNYLAEDHLKDTTFNNIKTTVWYDCAAPSFIDEDFNPWQLPAWWWSGWTKYSRIVQFDYDQFHLHVVLVKNWWKWNRPPKWWPDFTITTPAGGYFGFAGDWDVPDSAASKDLGAFDSTTNLIVYQYSDSTGFFNHYGGFGFLKAAVIHGTDTTKYTRPYSVHILTNKTQLYPDEGYNDDSLFKYMSQAGWSKEWSGTPVDSSQDLNIVVTAVKKLDPDTSTIITEEHFLLASHGGLTDFTNMAALMRKVKPGDVNLDGNINASDVVFLINYLFIGGPAPWMAYTDVNGDCNVNASDVVYLINYLFIGGPKPATSCWAKLPWL